MVAVGGWVAADRTGARNVPVCEEHFCFFVIILFGFFFFKETVVIQFFEKCSSGFVVSFVAGTRVDVERNAHFVEALFDHCVVFVNHLLRAHAFFQGAYGDGHTVFVAASHEFHVAFLLALVADVNIGGYVAAGEVADVQRAVCIG